MRENHRIDLLPRTVYSFCTTLMCCRRTAVDGANFSTSVSTILFGTDGVSATGHLEENGLKLEQTRGRDHDPCHEGGEAREQQQILQDDGHSKISLRSAEQSLRAVLSLRRRDRRTAASRQGTDGHRSPALCSIAGSASQDVGQKVMEDWLN